MIKEIKLVLAVLYWAALIGGILPFLFSAAHTELVLAGFVLLIVSAYVTYYRLTLKMRPKKKEEKSDA